MGDHAGPHQTERAGRDPLEVVIDAHGRLPIGVHPGPPRRLGVRGRAVMSGAQHGPHHHRRRDRRPPHPLRVQLGEIVITEDLMAMLGQPLIKRALRHQMPAHHPSLQQRTLRINPAQHTPKSIPPPTQSGGPSPARLYAGSPRPRSVVSSATRSIRPPARRASRGARAGPRSSTTPPLAEAAAHRAGRCLIDRSLRAGPPRLDATASLPRLSRIPSRPGRPGDPPRPPRSTLMLNLLAGIAEKIAGDGQ